ncbi:MAG: V-type ATPase subunit [Oscillospiraceae bacterium]|nr:V-type ATPase subunit [Oscillospiraceae bacterium]
MSEKKVTDYNYIFLTSALRAKEPKMLTKDKTERILDAQSFDDAAKMLTDCGYPDMSGMDAPKIEKTLSAHRAEIFSEVRELIPEPAILDVFCLKYDYHNAKVLIKAESAEIDGKYLLSDSGTVSAAAFAAAYYEEDYSVLSPVLAKALEEARGVIKRTENPQLADFILDRAYFTELKELAGKLYTPFVTDYVRIAIDGANLRAAVRTLRIGRDEDFLRNALITGGNIDAEQLASAAYADSGFAPLYEISPYREAALLGEEAAKGGRLTDFEKECDNVLTRFFASAGDISFGAQPVVAFLAAVENEITAARMILTGKLTGVNPSLIRERLRDIHA